jgi:hypothetical protein
MNYGPDGLGRQDWKKQKMRYKAQKKTYLLPPSSWMKHPCDMPGCWVITGPIP